MFTAFVRKSSISIFSHLTYFLILGTLSLFSSPIRAATVGEAAPSFSMPTIDGTSISLDSFQGKVVVLEWNDPKSPYVLKYYSKESMNGVGYIQSLQKKYTPPSTGVIWITVAPQSMGNAHYLTAEQWKTTLTEWGASPSHVIIDDKGALSHLFGVTVTPEVCVIDRGGFLVYRGAIDSIRGKSPSDVELVSDIHWLRMAIDNALKGKSVYTSETIPYGERIETKDQHSLF